MNLSRYMKECRLIRAGIIILMLTGCENVSLRPDNYDISMKSSTLAKSRQESQPCVNAVYIEPKQKLVFESKVAIFNFKSSKDAKEISEYMADYLHKLFLQRKTFRIVEKTGQAIDDLKYLMKYSKENGYNLIIVGEIHNIISGGETRQSQIYATFRVIDPKREITLLYLDRCETSVPKKAFSITEMKSYNIASALPKQLSALLMTEVADVMGSHTSGRSLY
ncbi:MAG: hypothetical protein H7844_14200 [Nitrospirae bacterium YQR-1]